MATFRLSSLSRGCLIALATSTSLPSAVMAASPWQVSDGSVLEVTTGYTSSTARDYPLLTSGEGSILQTTVPGLNFRTSGNLLYAASASGGGALNLGDAILSTNGILAHGINLDNGTLTMTGGSIFVSGQNSAGVYGSQQARLSLDNVAVTADGQGASSLLVTGGTAEIRNSTLLGTGAGSRGLVLAHSTNGEATATLENVNIILRSEGTQGALMLGNGTVKGHQVDLSATGKNRGIEIYNSSGGHGNIMLSDSTIGTQDGDGVYLLGGDVELDDTRVHTRNGIAVNVNKTAKATLTNSDFTTEGDHAYGLWIASADSSAEVRHSTFTTQGKGAHAFHAQFGPATLSDTELSTQGKGSYGLYSESTAQGNNVRIQTQGEGSIGAFAARGGSISLEQTSIVTSGKNSAGLLVYPGSTIYGDAIQVQTSGEDSHAAWARSGTLSIRNSQLNALGERASGLYISNNPTGDISHVTLDRVLMASEQSAAIRTNGDADIILKNGTQVVGGNGVLLDDQSSPDDQQRKVSLLAENAVILQGDIRAATGNQVTVSLNDHSQMKGATDNVASLGLDSSSLWVVTGNSSVAHFNHDGLVTFTHDEGAFSTLSLETLIGNGAFAMNTDLASLKGDLISVSGHISGSHLLSVKNTGREPDNANSALTVVRSGGGDGRFSLKGGAVDVGTWQYELQQRQNDWILMPKTQDGSGEEGPLVPTPSTVTALGLFNATPTAWYGELSTLRTRLGEARQGNGEGGVWVRMPSSQYNVNDRAGVSYRQRQTGISVGVDAPHALEQGTLLAGIFSGVSRNSLDFIGGSQGTLNSFYIGSYGTWLLDNGWFVDAVAKANNFSSRADVRMSDGQKATGGYSVPALGLSLEAGRHIPLSNDWFIEPSVQVSSLWVKGQSYTFSNALEADSGNVTSHQGALHGVLGKNLTLDHGLQIQPWLSMSVIQEFSDNNRVSINGNAFRNDLSGTRGEVGSGLAVQVVKDLQLYTDTHYVKGSKTESPWGLNIGARWTW